MRRRVSMKINIIKSLCIYDVYKKKNLLNVSGEDVPYLYCSLSLSLALPTIIIKIIISFLLNMNIQVRNLRKNLLLESINV